MLNLHDNGTNIFLFVNAVTMYQFKAKYSEVKAYSLRFSNTSKDFTLNNMKKNRFKGTVSVVSAHYNAISTISSLVLFIIIPILLYFRYS